MTPEELNAAIEWFDKRNTPMFGARKMYRLAWSALKALKVDQARLEGLNREGLIAMIHYLRTANINRGYLINQLEDENYRLKGGKE